MGYQDRLTEIKCFICMEKLRKGSTKGKFNHVYVSYNYRTHNRRIICPWYTSALFKFGEWGLAPERRMRGSKTFKLLPQEAQDYFNFLKQFKTCDISYHIKSFL
jgi:hypothetical protein